MAILCYPASTWRFLNHIEDMKWKVMEDQVILLFLVFCQVRFELKTNIYHVFMGCSCRTAVCSSEPAVTLTAGTHDKMSGLVFKWKSNCVLEICQVNFFFLKRLQNIGTLGKWTQIQFRVICRHMYKYSGWLFSQRTFRLRKIEFS